jgi:RNA polymerase sigma factor FliA
MALPPELEAELDRKVIELVPACRSIAWKHWHAAPTLEFEELLSLAFTGMAQARHSWERYCVKHSYDPFLTNYFGAYVSRRANGAILDYMRSLDWLPRQDRERARQLRDAGQGLGKPDSELAAATGMTLSEVAASAAAVSRRPVVFDASEHDTADASSIADVEGGVVMSSILDAGVLVLRALPVQSQAVAVLWFYRGMDARAVAAVTGLSAARVREMAQSAALAVHAAVAAVAVR